MITHTSPTTLTRFSDTLGIPPVSCGVLTFLHLPGVTLVAVTA